MSDITQKSILRYRSVDDGQVLSYLTPQEAGVRNKIVTEGISDDHRIAIRSSHLKAITGPSTTVVRTSGKSNYPEQNMPPMYRTLVQCILVIFALVVLLLLINLTYYVITSVSTPPPCVVPINATNVSCIR